MFRRIVLIVWVAAIASGCGSGGPQSSAVDELLARPFPADAEAAKAGLVDLGDRAVRGVTDAVRKENGASPERIDFLFDVLTSIGTPNAEVAMAELLADQRPLVRGRATDGLAALLARCATPALIKRLQDDAVYSDAVDRKRSLTVAEAAGEALQKLTGIQNRSESQSERARQFQTWWQANGQRLQCSDDWRKLAAHRAPGLHVALRLPMQ